MNSDNVVMWATRLSIVDWVFSKTQTLLATLRIQNQLRVSLMYLWKPNICHHWLDVQETNVSSTKSEIISLDAGLRMDGLPALDLWDVVIEVLRSTNNTERLVRLAPGNWWRDKKPFEQSNQDHNTN